MSNGSREFRWVPGAASGKPTGVWGRISPSGPVPVPHGGSQIFSINPVADVPVDGVSVGAVNSATFTNGKGNPTLSATLSS